VAEHLRRKRTRGPRGDMEGYLMLLLLDEPLTIDQMAGKTQFLSFEDRQPVVSPQARLEVAVNSLRSKGLVDETDGRFNLTEAGRARALRAKSVMTWFGEYLSSGAAAAKLSIIVTAFLSVLKLSAGILSNSVGLVSDGIDNLADVVSSGVVYLGIKRKREFYATVFIIVLMFIVAAGLLYNSVARLLHPSTVEVGLLPVLAAVVSGVTCYLLYNYQRFVGRRSANMSLISESVDSLNHVVTAVAVLLGIIAAALGTSLIDSLVGIFVAGFILRGSTALTLDTLKAREGKGMDLSHWGSSWEKAMTEARRRHLEVWLLHRLERPMDIAEIGMEFDKTFSGARLPVLKATGLDMFEGFDFADGKQTCDELVRRGLLRVEDRKYVRTEDGALELEELQKRPDRIRRRKDKAAAALSAR